MIKTSLIKPIIRPQVQVLIPEKISELFFSSLAGCSFLRWEEVFSGIKSSPRDIIPIIMSSRLVKSVISRYLPLLIWCGVIFFFSNQPKTINIGPNYWTDFAAKKTAHLIEYGILAILSYRALNKSKISALIFVILYGLSDEFHQSFIPGREPRIRDVAIDFIGGFIGIWSLKFIPAEIQKKLGI